MHVEVYGPEDGEPIVFLHGSMVPWFHGGWLDVARSSSRPTSLSLLSSRFAWSWE